MRGAEEVPEPGVGPQAGDDLRMDSRAQFGLYSARTARERTSKDKSAGSPAGAEETLAAIS